MAHVTGSFDTTTLPGSVRRVPDGQACDDCYKPATHRVQGETDSFGAEWADLCDECGTRERERRRKDCAGNCDWCKEHTNALTSTRDYDEGTHGPVYHVCKWCCDKQQRALEEELQYYESNGY
ncbi:MAG: hypothetical protein Q7T01_02170 [bacterium]|nr:hypothetical protein [bacterium]